MSEQDSRSHAGFDSYYEFQDSTPTQIHSATYETHLQYDMNSSRLLEYLRRTPCKFLPVFFQVKLTEQQNSIWRQTKQLFGFHRVESMFQSSLHKSLTKFENQLNVGQLLEELVRKGYLQRVVNSQGVSIITLPK